ncbi:hypothetical protein D3C79_697780 [compost metagenome]
MQQVGLLRHRLLAAAGFAVLDFGDIGEQHHPPAVLGRPFADLQPASTLQAIQQVLVAGTALLFAEQAAAVHQALDLGQAHAADDADATVGPERFEAAVEQHDAQVRIEQYERVGDTLDGIDQVLVSGFRTQAGIAEQVVAGLELDQGLVQRIGTLAHLLGQHHRVLERRIGVVRPRRAGLQAFDQCGVDP